MTSSLASSAQAMNALLTEHLTYTPLVCHIYPIPEEDDYAHVKEKTLVDEIINTVNEVVYRAVTAIEQGLSDAGPEVLGFTAGQSPTELRRDVDEQGKAVYPDVQAEIDEGVHRLETLLEATVDKTFDKVELYMLRNILYVEEQYRPFIRLAHYNNVTVTKQQDEQSLEGLLKLRRKAIESHKLHAALQAESARNRQLMEQLQALTSHNSTQSLAFLTANAQAKKLGIDFQKAGASEQGYSPILAEVEIAIAQLPALRKLLATLRPKVATLQQATLSEPDRERSDYIESAARRQLEVTGANVRTGGGLAGRPARRVGREEVAAMELVAGLLDGSNARRRRRSDR